ncbi:MAG: hypothetical protein ABGZ53_10765 [Fuerstiella sp.]
MDDDYSLMDDDYFIMEEFIFPAAVYKLDSVAEQSVDAPINVIE